MRTLCMVAVLAPLAWTDDDLEKRIDELERARRSDKERIEQLERKLEQRDATDLEREIEQYLDETPPAPRPAQQKFIDISADLIFSIGGSTATNEELLFLQDGGHDPRRRGFTLNQLELAFAGNVDPYFRLEAYVILFLDPEEQETEIELEEAFFTTLRMPYNLQLKGGTFFTAFGRHNPQHPEQWTFVDTPFVLTRFFGPDGMRGPGFQLSWIAPTRNLTQVFFSMQNAEGETMVSFRGNEEVGDERPVDGRPFVEQSVGSLDDFVYLVRIESSWDLDASWTLVLGGSGAFGPNYTGPDGDTVIWGVDVHLKWRPAATDKGWPFVVIQGEYLGRNFDADDFDDGMGTTFPDETFKDDGLYAQVVYGWRRPWSVGFRLEWFEGDGASAETDVFRNDRTRYSLLLSYHTSEFGRIRLQGSYEDNDLTAQGDVFSVWLVFEFGIGAHPAHTY